MRKRPQSDAYFGAKCMNGCRLAHTLELNAQTAESGAYFGAKCVNGRRAAHTLELNALAAAEKFILWS